MTDERLAAIEAAWLKLCGSCDAGLATSCTCSDRDPRQDIGWLAEQLRDARDEIERLANEPHCCPPCAVHPDPEAREIGRIAASIDMGQIVAQGGVDTGQLVAHILRESGIQSERDALRGRLAAVERLCVEWGDEPWPEGRRPVALISFIGHVRDALAAAEQPEAETATDHG